MIWELIENIGQVLATHYLSISIVLTSDPLIDGGHRPRPN
jgi:hypothetical protein